MDDTSMTMDKNEGCYPKNRNWVKLISYVGGDIHHCVQAWQSTALELGINLEHTKNINSIIELLFSATVKKKKKTPEELFEMLFNTPNEPVHSSPFEHSLLMFQTNADIRTHIHCLKHRIGVSINSESARYKELSDKWYIPMDWEQVMLGFTMPGGDEMQPLWKGFFRWAGRCVTWADVLNAYTKMGHILYHHAIKQLTPSLGKKRAKETAAYFFTTNKQLTYGFTCNFTSFVNFQQKRNHPSAQKEVRELAQSMLEQVRAIPGNPFRYSLKAAGMDVDRKEGYVK